MVLPRECAAFTFKRVLVFTLSRGVLDVAFDVVDGFQLFRVFAAPEVRILLPEEVPTFDDGGGVELSVLWSAVDPQQMWCYLS